MTISEALTHLATLGIKKTFKPYMEPETETVMLRTRRPAQIIEGRLSGSEIALQGSDFNVWTSQKQKAKAMAGLHGLKVRLFDGEAEVMVPSLLADDLLPKLGAKVKRVLSPKQADNLKRARQYLTNGPDSAFRPSANGGKSIPNPIIDQTHTDGVQVPESHAGQGLDSTTTI